MKLFIRRHGIALMLALGACNHANCDDNEAAQYARFLDSEAQCWGYNNINDSRRDVAFCRVGSEHWCCIGATCFNCDQRIITERKR